MKPKNENVQIKHFDGITRQWIDVFFEPKELKPVNDPLRLLSPVQLDRIMRSNTKL